MNIINERWPNWRKTRGLSRKESGNHPPRSFVKRFSLLKSRGRGTVSGSEQSLPPRINTQRVPVPPTPRVTHTRCLETVSHGVVASSYRPAIMEPHYLSLLCHACYLPSTCMWVIHCSPIRPFPSCYSLSDSASSVSSLPFFYNWITRNRRIVS